MVLDIIKMGIEVLNKVIPDKEAREKAQLELIRLQQEGHFKELELEMQGMQAQTEINKVEAENASVFVSGWRPAAGWLCVGGLGYTFFVQPIATFVSSLFAGPAAPQLDTSDLLTLLLGLLGLVGARSLEKRWKVSRS